MKIDPEQQAARAHCEALRDRICAQFEDIEREAGSDAAFQFTPWERQDHAGEPGGGGVRGLLKGRVFEKAGVNVSTVYGTFAPEFTKSIRGAEADPRFFATGISLVAHMANPHVPAVHMNQRFLVTTRRWFGGGADLNPPTPYETDTADFHASMQAACARSPAGDYGRFKQWADDYFWLPHRQVHRGVGGIFFDHIEGRFADGMRLIEGLGDAFCEVFPRLVRRRMDQPFTETDRARQLEWRGRYAEFNLLYDRGTLFGLKTGGNIDAILMSLPPLVTWS